MRQTNIQRYTLVVAMTSLLQASAQDWGPLGNPIFSEGSNDFSGLGGAAVALSADGGRLAVGASYNDDGGEKSGHVRVFEYTAGNWVQLGTDLDGTNVNGLAGHAVALSATGDRVVFGAHYIGSGEVQIFDYGVTNWVQSGTIFGEVSGDNFGWSLALSADGNRLAVGARLHNGDGITSRTGNVRVFDWTGDSWTNVGSAINGEAWYDQSGFAVSLSADGTRLAIGTPYSDIDETIRSTGDVRVFQQVGANWDLVGTNIVGNTSWDQLGYAVSLSADGTCLAVGVPYDDSSSVDAGKVMVFEQVGTNWLQLGNSIFGEAEDDYSGISVSLSADGTRVAVGAHFNDNAGDNAGYVRVFDYVDGQWVQNGSNIEGIGTEEKFGYRVAISADGRRVAGGSRTEDLGQVRVYALQTAVPVTIADGCLNFLTVSNASYSLYSSGTLTNGFSVFDSVSGNGLTNCVPIDFSSDQQFFKCLEALD
jgi:hypothetical protein